MEFFLPSRDSSARLQPNQGQATQVLATNSIVGRTLICISLFGLCFAALAGCGSNGGTPLAQGANQTIQIIVTAQGGFTGTVSISAANTPVPASPVLFSSERLHGIK
jgi:hypothetical protein